MKDEPAATSTAMVDLVKANDDCTTPSDSICSDEDDAQPSAKEVLCLPPIAAGMEVERDPCFEDFDLAAGRPSAAAAAPSTCSAASSSVGETPTSTPPPTPPPPSGPPPGMNGDCARRPAAVGRRTSGRIREKVLLKQQEQAEKKAAMVVVTNGVSPRKLHKKLKLKSSSSSSSAPGAGAACDDEKVAMKVKSRWRRCSELESSIDSSSDETSNSPVVVVVGLATVGMTQLKIGDDDEKHPVASGSLDGWSSTSGDHEFTQHHEVVKAAEAVNRDDVDAMNSSEEAKLEIRNRLSSFEYVEENLFICQRRFNKQNLGMECDCSLSKEEIQRGVHGCGDHCLNRLLMIECDKSCSLGKLCANRRFQNIENAPTEVFKTRFKGIGLRATAVISEDTFIMEYVGEVLDLPRFRKRARKYSKNDVQHFYFMALSTEYFVDASNKGSISRFINHSCDPNAETQKWTVGGELRVGFFSKRKIAKGEEITFDYKYERYGQHAQKCYCGSANCRGWLGGDPDCKEAAGGEEDDDEEDDEDVWSSSGSEQEAALPKLKGVSNSVTSTVPTSSVPAPVPVAKPKRISARRKLKKSPRKVKNYEDDAHEEEIERFKATGIRTKANTLGLCRLMVRTTDLGTRLTLATLLRNAEKPCRRLFLDYHGLRILHGWMSELNWSFHELELKLALEDVLGVLSVPHKTMLVDSRVWETMMRWSVDDRGPSSVDVSSTGSPDLKPEGPLEQKVERGEEVGETAAEAAPCSAMSEAKSEDATGSISTRKTEETAVDAKEEPLAEGSPKRPEPEPMDVEPEPMDVDPISDEVFVLPKMESVGEQVAATLSSQEVRSTLDDDLKDSAPVEVPPIAKGDAAASTWKEDNKASNTKIAEVRSKAAKLLDSWKMLEEVFKIPRKMLVAMRAEHEREADEAEAQRRKNCDQFEKRSGYERSRPLPRPDAFSPLPAKRETRMTRFDDATGELKQPNLPKHLLRNLFLQQCKLAEEEKVRRGKLQALHENKCYFLRLDPATTPMFPEMPEFYFDPDDVAWYKMPELTPDVDVTWGFPGMALLPLEAFREDDPPLPDVAYIYPPGIVKVSYFYGRAMSLDPSINGASELMPQFYVDPDTGQQIPVQGDDSGRRPHPPQAAPSLSDENRIFIDNLLAPPPPPPEPLNVEDIPPVPSNHDPPPHSVPAVVVLVAAAASASASASAANTSEILVKLPLGWRIGKDPEGRAYYYNVDTCESRWNVPREEEGASASAVVDMECVEEIAVVEMETASTCSKEDLDEADDDDDDSSDDEEDEEDIDKEDEETPGDVASMPAAASNNGIAVPDLSAQQQSLPIKLSKKTKEERQHERRQKRERDREKREYERKRRREKHGKHRKDGLVVERIIPRRTEFDKSDMMSFEEIRERLANRDAIRERQAIDELAEDEQDREEERKKRALARERLAEETAAAATTAGPQQQHEKEQEPQPSCKTTTAAADTSSEVAKKIKDKFLKDVSKVIVKALDPFRRGDLGKAQIATTEDFKHLAKKLTNYIFTKEMKHCNRIEDLKCSDSVKKKTSEFVSKYMTKFSGVYKRSPPTQPGK